MAREKFVQIESKNALLELLQEGKDFTKIFLAANAYKDPKTTDIISLANRKRIPVEKIARRSLLRFVKKGNMESVVGLMVADNMTTLPELLESIHSNNQQPFFLIFDHVKYDQNIGAILRTAFASGVNGIITPIDIKNFLTNDTIRVSMGASLRLPIVEMNLFAAMKELQRNGVQIMGLAMEGSIYYKTDLTGPIAFVLGAEDVGLSPKIEERLEKRISIPMREGIGSLNVSASAAVVMYEKLRQEVHPANL